MLEERWRSDRSPRVFLQLADELRRVGRRTRAVEVLRDGLEWHPESVSGWVALGRLLLDEGEAEAAIAALDQAVERDPAQLVAHRLLAEAWIRTGDAERADAELERCRLLSLPEDDHAQLAEQIRALRSEAPATPAASPEPAARPDRPFELASPERLPEIDLGRVGRGRRGWVRVEVSPEPFAELLAGRAPSPARLERRLREGGVFAGPEAASAAPRAAPPSAPAPTEATALEIGDLAEAAPPALAAPPVEPVFQPLSIGEEVERETAEAPDEAAADATAEPAEIEAVAGVETNTVATPPAASSTLAALYLSQGHLDEAEAEYLRVLAVRPADGEALGGLAAVERRRAEAAAPARPAAPGPGLTARKLTRLRRLYAGLRRRRLEGSARVS